MGDYTFLRVDVDSDAIAAVLDRVPGVAAVDDLPASDDEESRSVIESVPTEDTESAPEPDTDATESDLKGRLWALAREWGLLGAGVSLIGLGVATAGLWWYRRRKSNGDQTDGERAKAHVDSRGETPPPESTASSLDREEDESESEQRATGETTVLAETDRESGENEETTASEPETDDGGEGRAGDEGSEENGSVDVAPLLGVGFLVLLGALVRWAQGEHDGRT